MFCKGERARKTKWKKKVYDRHTISVVDFNQASYSQCETTHYILKPQAV